MSAHDMSGRGPSRTWHQPAPLVCCRVKSRPPGPFMSSRPSSATNVGADRDSAHRQRETIQEFAAKAGYRIIAEHYDAAVSGADPVDERPGFTAMLAQIAGNGVRTIIVETANRFARDLIVQETGHRKLRELGIELIAADSPDSFVDDTPTAVMVRQILGAVAQFEKAALVAKLKGARDRKKRQTGKCGGRRAHAELRPDVVALAKKLRSKRLTLREVGLKLAEAGHLNAQGRPFAPESIRSMLQERP